MSRDAPGILFLYLVEAILLTLPVSLVLVWWYRRVMVTAMRLAAAGEGITVLDVTPRDVRPPVEGPDAVNGAERSSRVRTAVVYTAATLAAALLWAFLYFRTSNLEFKPVRAFVVWYTFCWSLVPTLVTMLAIRRSRALWLAVGYLVLGGASVVIWSAISGGIIGSPLEDALNFLKFVALWVPPAALIILIVAHRRIRAVSPLVLAGLLIYTFSSVGVTDLFARLASTSRLRNALLALGAESSLKLWILIFTLPICFICWRLLAVLNARFQYKSFSDLQLLADSYWLIIAFTMSAHFSVDWGWGGLSGLAGFVIYRLVAEIGMAMWPAPAVPGVRLLMLRVFGFQHRTEKLFDSIAQRWRFRGGVKMIAGADLAARTIDPDDTLAFVGGALRSRFVQSHRNLERQLCQCDELRDPDGRFRVTKFYCHKNTWSGTLSALLGRADVILMDLRGFSKHNEGCVFELRQLAAQLRLTHTVFVVDDATNIDLMTSTIGVPMMPGLHLEKVQKDSAAARERVYRALRSINLDMEKGSEAVAKVPSQQE